MATSEDHLAAAVGAAAGHELTKALERITHCVNQLTDAQIWSRPAEGMNSIGNLMLHLCGNLRQWIVAGVGGAADTRNRPAEFAERGPIAKAELLSRLEKTVAEAKAALARQSAPQLLEMRTIQGFEVNGLDAIFDSVPHFRGHAQEIIHMTRSMLDEAYRFAWNPATAAEGA